MNDFVYLYRGGQPATASPSDRQAQLERWGAWFKELAKGEHVKDPGHPLERTGKVVQANKAVTDGPYAEAKDLVGGYSIVRAKDLAQAVELSHGCPIFLFGGTVEVRPVIPMNM